MAHPDQLSRVLRHNESYVFFGRRAGPRWEASESR